MERAATALADAGHDVTAIVLPCEGEPAEAHRGGFRLLRVPYPSWATWKGPLRVVALERWFDRARTLVAAAEELRPEILHAVDLDTLLPAARLAARIGIPLVYEDRELCLDKIRQGTPEWLGGAKRKAMDFFNRRLESRGLAIERRWIPGAAGFLTASSLYADVLERRHGRRPVVLRNTPPRSDLPPDPRLRSWAGLPPESRVVLYQGRITPSGGAQECIAAAASFPPGWHLVFLGVTWMRPVLEAEIRTRGVGDRVRIIPLVPPEILPGFTRAADIGISPLRPVNRGQSYSQAHKIFEYLHAGLPIIASDVPGQAAIVRELDAGLLLPAVTPESVAGAVRSLSSLPEGDRRALGNRLREIARRELCWECESGKLTGLYEEILGRSPTAG